MKKKPSAALFSASPTRMAAISATSNLLTDRRTKLGKILQVEPIDGVSFRKVFDILNIENELKKLDPNYMNMAAQEILKMNIKEDLSHFILRTFLGAIYALSTVKIPIPTTDHNSPSWLLHLKTLDSALTHLTSNPKMYNITHIIALLVDYACRNAQSYNDDLSGVYSFFLLEFYKWFIPRNELDALKSPKLYQVFSIIHLNKLANTVYTNLHQEALVKYSFDVKACKAASTTRRTKRKVSTQKIASETPTQRKRLRAEDGENKKAMQNNTDVCTHACISDHLHPHVKFMYNGKRVTLVAINEPPINTEEEGFQRDTGPSATR